jgi:hypothetical protein
MNEQTITAPGAPDIPKRYADFGVRNEWDPTPAEQQRILLTSLPGHGKTNFVRSIPGALVIDPERMCRDVIKGHSDYAYLPSIAKYESLLKLLIEDGNNGRAHYRMIVFDTIDKFIQGSIAHLTAEWNKVRKDRQIRTILELGEKGHGWTVVQDYVFSFLEAISGAGYGWICVGHIRPNELTRPVMKPGFLEYIFREATTWMHLGMSTRKEVSDTGETETIKTAAGKEVLRKKKSQAIINTVHLAVQDLNTDPEKRRNLKGRYIEYMPPEIEVPLGEGWNAYKTHYDSAIESARKSLTK